MDLIVIVSIIDIVIVKIQMGFDYCMVKSSQNHDFCRNSINLVQNK